MVLFTANAIAVLSAGPAYWTPPANTSWQWQLSGKLDTTVNAAMYDIDLFTNNASIVSSLHSQGKRVVCYVSAGSWENFRPDASSFPESVKGLPLDGYPDERWLDIRNLDVLGPILSARLDMCKAKGFDAVEPDNVDGFSNNSGFPLTYADQIRFNTWIANAAHARGLSVGLKNDLDQAKDLQPMFDWALNEQCFEYGECNKLNPFSIAGKAVFHVEYNLDTSAFCPQANVMNFNSMLKHDTLDSYRVACRNGSSKAIMLSPNGVVNAASLGPNSVAPGEIITIFGAGLGPIDGASLNINAAGTVDTTLSGVRVYFDGIAAPLMYVQSGQVNVGVPYEVSGKTSTQVQVEFMGVQSDVMLMNVTQTAPGIFTVAPGGTGQAAALNQDNTANSASNAAPAGSVIVLFATGEGQTDPAGVDGRLAVDSLPKPIAPVSVQIAGLNAEVLYAGAAPGEVAGVMQVNVRIPSNASPGKAVPVQLTIGNAVSQSGVTLAIQ
jgi:uncharacterized protein (TIGR03437 family)